MSSGGRGLQRKVRKNADFIHVTRELDRLGIPWMLCPAPGKGHPYLQIGDRLKWPVATSPRSYLRSGTPVSRLRNALRENGMLI